jgi:tetratricopeptide (TPR) repeat protein
MEKIMTVDYKIKNLGVKVLSLIFLLPSFAFSMQLCDKKMNEFDEDFSLNEESNVVVREKKLESLDKYKEVCEKDVRYIEKYADSLFVVGRGIESLKFIENSINSVSAFKGNIIYKKYEILNFSKKYNIDLGVNLEWDEIRHGFLSALEEENTVERRVYVKIAEVSIEMKDFDLALLYADKGLVLTKNQEPRFLNLAAIAEMGKKDYKQAISYLQSSAETFGPKNYYNEPDTVFSAVYTLCHFGEVSIAKNILSNALDSINYSEGKEIHDDYVRAQIIINKCNKKLNE